MPLLHCQKLTRDPWFRNLDFKLEAGQVRVIMGPSGSGKSLFLRSLADLDPVDAGQIWLEGCERGETSPGSWRRRVLYMHQNSPRLPGKVLQNLRATEGPDPLPQSFNPFELNYAQEAAELSGGEAQMMALTRALHTAPQVYLMDEATSALDSKRALRVEAEMRQRLALGAAILWVTHDERIAERMGAEVLDFGALSR